MVKLGKRAGTTTWASSTTRPAGSSARGIPSGVSKSEYARRAMEEFEQRLMQERIADLSRQLAAHSASAAQSMEGSTADGLE
jgi:hypothetical protein